MVSVLKVGAADAAAAKSDKLRSPRMMNRMEEKGSACDFRQVKETLRSVVRMKTVGYSCLRVEGDGDGDGDVC